MAIIERLCLAVSIRVTVSDSGFVFRVSFRLARIHANCGTTVSRYAFRNQNRSRESIQLTNPNLLTVFLWERLPSLDWIIKIA